MPRKLLWDIISHQADARTKNEKEKKGDMKMVSSKHIQLVTSQRIAFSVHVRASSSKSSIE